VSHPLFAKRYAKGRRVRPWPTQAIEGKEKLMSTKLLTSAMVLSLLGMTSAFAVADRSTEAQTSTSQSTSTASAPADRTAPAATASRLVENAKRLQQEAEDIASATSDSERQRLLQRRIQTLRAAMMLSAGMMSGDPGQPWMRGGPGGAPGMGHGIRRGGMGHGMRRGGMGPGMLTMMMAMMDTNSDGALSLEEVQAVHARMFSYVDADEDGKLTRDELRSFFHHGDFDFEND